MTTATPTLATLRSALAAAERRLAAANDEADAAQEAFDLAVASLAEAHENLDATAGEVRTSACAGRAWDVDVAVLDTDGSTVAEGEVTLVVGEYDGRPSPWGVTENWASHGLLVLLSDHPGLCDRVAAVARTAIEASGVAPSPEYEG